MVQRTVKLIGAGFCDGVYDGATGTTKFSIVVRCLHGNFLYGFRILDLEPLTSNGDVVVFSSIKKEVIEAASGAVYGKRGSARKVGTLFGYAGQGDGQRVGIAAENRDGGKLGLC